MTLKLFIITFDCANKHNLATFWSAVLRAENHETDSEEDDAVVGPIDTGQILLFVNVPEAKTAKNRLHFDLHTPDHALEVARVTELGATVLNEVRRGDHLWTVLTDPEGNEFCIVENKES